MVVSERVRVISDFNKIFFVEWKHRSYKVDKVGFHHTVNDGNTLTHIFSVLAGSVFLKLKLNTKHLDWTLLEVHEEN
jgi:hypothetical protein